MSSELALSVHEVSKVYTITEVVDRPTTLAEAAMSRLRRGLRAVPKKRFEALSDVTFDVGRGQVLGIIGHNGAGKSTLLKILSRVTSPTSGWIDVYGKVGSLLEVGTGFHPELTGRENIYLNGAIIGMRRAEVARQFESIVEFAGITEFLDTPVKRYSSGMYVRLAFAVGAHLRPDILVVDEVLAVGDAQFQRKCLGKMEEVTSRDGRTVLFVSHNMAAIESLCSRCIYLEHGRVVYDGDVRESIQRYLAYGSDGDNGAGVYNLKAAQRAEPRVTTVDATAHPPAPILDKLTIEGPDGRPTDTVRAGDRVRLIVDVSRFALGSQLLFLQFRGDAESTIAGVHSGLRPLMSYGGRGDPERFVLTIDRFPLLPGRYWIHLEVGQGAKGNEIIDAVERAAQLEVVPTDLFGSGWSLANRKRFGFVVLDPQWEVYGSGELLAKSGGE